VAIFSLALGIGANLTIFSIVNGLMLRPMPALDPSALVNMYATSRSADYSPLSFPDYRRYRDRAAVFVDITAYQISNFAIGSESTGRMCG